MKQNLLFPSLSLLFIQISGFVQTSVAFSIGGTNPFVLPAGITTLIIRAWGVVGSLTSKCLFRQHQSLRFGYINFKQQY